MMTATMIPIQSITLTASAASVTFTGIPQTYTDLVLRVSARTVSGSQASVALAPNDSQNLTSRTTLSGNGQTASSTRTTGDIATFGYASAYSDTANTFSSDEIYIHNYTASINKPMTGFGVAETNNVSSWMGAVANLYVSTAPITSLTAYLSGSFATGSTFHLYGIKNS